MMLWHESKSWRQVEAAEVAAAAAAVRIKFTRFELCGLFFVHMHILTVAISILTLVPPTHSLSRMIGIGS